MTTLSPSVATARDEVVNGFFVNDRAVMPRAALSYIPSGTGNDVAKHWVFRHRKKKLFSVSQVLLDSGRQMLDVGKSPTNVLTTVISPDIFECCQFRHERKRCSAY